MGRCLPARHAIPNRRQHSDTQVAPLVLDGPINRAAFEAYVAEFLVPDVRPGDIVIKDNLSSHKGTAICAMIEAVGATLLYLPPYSPGSADPLVASEVVVEFRPASWCGSAV